MHISNPHSSDKPLNGAVLTAVKHHFRFVKSIYAGTIHLVRKTYSGKFFSILARFHKSISDESIVAFTIAHFEIVRIMNRSGPRALTERYPNYVNKYLTEYLAKSISKKSRREILKFHHQYLIEHLAESFYEQILQSRAVLWSEIIEENSYAISMSFDAQWHSEGDISLTFDKNATPLYEISFSIVPGNLINCATDQALLVGRLQGRKGQIEQIRISTKACHDIAPPHLLLAAVQAIAGILAIDAVGGVSNDEQLAKSVHDASGCYFDYDAFWESNFFQRTAASLYIGPVPFPDKPIEHITTSHRRRTRIKRRLKKQIAEYAGATFAKNFLKPQSSQNKSRHTTVG